MQFTDVCFKPSISSGPASTVVESFGKVQDALDNWEKENAAINFQREKIEPGQLNFNS